VSPHHLLEEVGASSRPSAALARPLACCKTQADLRVQYQAQGAHQEGLQHVAGPPTRQTRAGARSAGHHARVAFGFGVTVTVGLLSVGGATVVVQWSELKA